MTDDQREIEDPLPEISPATGDFYHSYKRDLASFIEDAKVVCRDALASGKLKPADAVVIERELANLERTEFLKLLSKVVNEEAPSFFAECTVSATTGMLKSIFLVARHAAFTESARALALKAQAEKARAGKAAKASQGTQSKRDRLIDDSVRNVIQRWRSEGKPFPAVAVLEEVNKTLAAASEPRVSEATVRRRMKKLPSSLQE